MDFDLSAVLALLPEEHRPPAVLPAGEGDRLLYLLRLCTLLEAHGALGLGQIGLTGSQRARSWSARFHGFGSMVVPQQTPHDALQSALMAVVTATPAIRVGQARARQETQRRADFRARCLCARGEIEGIFSPKADALPPGWLPALVPWLLTSTEASLCFSVQSSHKFDGNILTAPHAIQFARPYYGLAPEVAAYLPPERDTGITVGTFRRLIKAGILTARVVPDFHMSQLTPNPACVTILRAHALLPPAPFAYDVLHPKQRQDGTTRPGIL